jgi:hypothetical protein
VSLAAPPWANGDAMRTVIIHAALAAVGWLAATGTPACPGPPPAGCIGHVFAEGSSGACVRWIQADVNVGNYPGWYRQIPVTGFYGPPTRAAAAAFQRDCDAGSGLVPGEPRLHERGRGGTQQLVSLPRLAGKVRVIMASDLANPRLAGKGNRTTEVRGSSSSSLRYEDADGRADPGLGLAPGELDVEYVAMDGTAPPADAARIRLADTAPAVGSKPGRAAKPARSLVVGGRCPAGGL